MKKMKTKADDEHVLSIRTVYGYVHMTLDACAVPARGLSPTTCVSLEREISGWLIEARSGHGHFAA